MKILTSEQMRNIDRRAIEQFGIPSIVLMENAAIAVAEAIERHFAEAESIAIFCGPGQNGGDGFAVARHLESRSVTPLVFIVGSRERYSGDSKTNLEICARLGLPMYEVTSAGALDEALARASEADLIVDAIFGTGLNRPPAELYAEAIRGIMSLRLPVLAVDLPSGLNGSSPEPFEPAITAEYTVTFAQPKLAHVFEPAASHCGEIVVADISIPRAAVESENVVLEWTTADDVALLVPPRLPTTHKGSYGHTGIIAGSEGRSGAAVLALRGALRMGSGLVTLFTDRETTAIAHASSIESMSKAIATEGEESSFLDAALEKVTAVVVGPGLADDESSYVFVRSALRRIALPTIVDASALNAFAGRAGELRHDSAPRVITPHPGELSRLLGRATSEINRNRVGSAKEAASLTGAVVVLKGHQTIVADPEGPIAVNPTGNAGMASGGMGDVLAGMIGALLAQGLAPFDAARAGVFLHGLAGDMLRGEMSDIGILAGDLAERIPLAVERLRNES